MFENVKLSIIIVDHTSHIFLKELENSLKNIEVPFEIVHITNGDRGYQFESTPYFTSYHFPTDDVISSKSLGLVKARGEYVLMVENNNYLLDAEQINKCLKLGKDIYFFNGERKLIIKKKILDKYNIGWLLLQNSIENVLNELVSNEKVTFEVIEKPLYFYNKKGE